MLERAISREGPRYRPALEADKVSLNFQTGSKKNHLLSGDVMKEMARQAKALREKRKAGLDGRHKWVFTKVR